MKSSESHAVVSDSLWSYGLYPARLLYTWNSPGNNTGVVAIPFSRGSSWPRGWTVVSWIGFFTTNATWEVVFKKFAAFYLILNFFYFSKYQISWFIFISGYVSSEDLFFPPFLFQSLWVTLMIMTYLFLNWSRVGLQCCFSFRYTAKWFRCVCGSFSDSFPL